MTKNHGKLSITTELYNQVFQFEDEENLVDNGHDGMLWDAILVVGMNKPYWTKL